MLGVFDTNGCLHDSAVVVAGHGGVTTACQTCVTARAARPCVVNDYMYSGAGIFVASGVDIANPDRVAVVGCVTCVGIGSV